MGRRKKDQEIGDVLSKLGFAFEFFKAIAHTVMAKGGTMKHLRRVVNDNALQRHISDLIVPAGSVTPKPLAENEYLVPVSYAPLPSFADLEKEFGNICVSNLFDGREWKDHSSCVGIDKTPCDAVFLVKHFDRETGSEDNITEMDKLGYRPATHIEAYEFQRKHPELQRQFRIVALGSFAMDDVRRCVAVLSGNSDRRIFGNDWVGSRWSAGFRFLFVRR